MNRCSATTSVEKFLAETVNPPCWLAMTTDFKTTQVATRFGLRIPILGGFAAFGDPGFGRSFAALLLLSIILCFVAGLMRRERPLASTLTHWDEAAAYGLLYALTVSLDQAAS